MKNLLLAAFIFLTGCATLSQSQGLFSVVTPTTHQSGHFIWQEDAAHQKFYLELSGPLGLGATSLSNETGPVVLTLSSGKTIVADSPEDLLQNTLGWSMPVSGMGYWILGKPVPTLPFTGEYDSQHRLLTLHQSGWVIHYTWNNAAPYPSQIMLLRSDIKILLAPSKPSA